MNRNVKIIFIVIVMYFSVQNAFSETTQYASYDFDTNSWVDIGIIAPENVVCTIEYQGKLVALVGTNKLLEYDPVSDSWEVMDIDLPEGTVEVKPLLTETEDELLIIRTSDYRLYSYLEDIWEQFSFHVPETSTQIVSNYYIGLLSQGSQFYYYDVYEDILIKEDENFPFEIQFIISHLGDLYFISNENEVYKYSEESVLIKTDIKLDQYIEVFSFNNMFLNRYK